MSKLNVFALFHLNLAYSSIEEEQRPDVIERAYWPLLRLPEKINAPVAIEASAYTLEAVGNWIEGISTITITLSVSLEK